MSIHNLTRTELPWFHQPYKVVASSSQSIVQLSLSLGQPRLVQSQEIANSTKSSLERSSSYRATKIFFTYSITHSMNSTYKKRNEFGKKPEINFLHSENRFLCSCEITVSMQLKFMVFGSKCESYFSSALQFVTKLCLAFGLLIFQTL